MLLGIDVGTSSLKSMLLDPEKGTSLLAAREYDVEIPREGYAEQSPGVWWDALKETLRELRERAPAKFRSVTAVGFSGQMHGLVMTDKNGIPLRGAIVWLDQRSGRQVAQMNAKLPGREIEEILQNRPFPGFAVPSLLWVKENERKIYDQCACVMQAKDYLRMKLTGEPGTDASDASATAGFDVGQRQWAYDILTRLGLDREKFPPCREATEVAGEITAAAAEETGLRKGIPVVFGAGDQPAQSIGNGAVREGLVISNIGTGGQIAAYSAKDVHDRELRTHTFCHAVDKAYTVFGASLCSGLSMKWLKNNVLGVSSYDEMSALAARSEPCSGGLVYLPYLTGERTPHMNPKAKGMFFGLTLGHDRRHFARAVMEGVTFALRDSLEILENMGISAERIVASGGGARSGVWLQIQADIFGKEVAVCRVKEQACLGACILAGLGTGTFANAGEAAERLVSFEEKTSLPDMSAHREYSGAYETFREIYRANKGLFGG